MLVPDFIKSSHCCNLLGGIEDLAHWPLHVGLAGTNPDIPEENVRDGQRGLTLLAHTDLADVGLGDRVKDH